jgi:tripartite-type tricarboxylate transporter receptor subunit TctC
MKHMRSTTKSFGRTLLTRVLATAALSAAFAAQAAYPDRAITLIVTTSAGGPNDTVARIVAGELAETLKTPVIVENVAGSGGNIAAHRVAVAAPDGYTLLLMSTSLTINPSLYESVQFDPVTSFRPIGLIGTSPQVLVVRPGSPFHNVGDIVAYAKAHPGKLTYASGGNGTTSHLGMELFKSMAGIDILHVPYRGMAPALMDVSSSIADMGMSPLPSAEQLVKGGKLGTIVMSDTKRSARLPDVPTFAEQGMPRMDVRGWWGVAGPAKMPADAAQTLERALAEALSSAKIREALVAQGIDTRPEDANAFRRLIKDEVTKWRAIVASSGAKIGN